MHGKFGHRIMGMETEFGIADADNPHANILALCAMLVQSYAEKGRASSSYESVNWDYRGETPLNDARGYAIPRDCADPSQLTDDPYVLAPSADSRRERRSYDISSCSQRSFSASSVSSPSTDTAEEASVMSNEKAARSDQAGRFCSGDVPVFYCSNVPRPSEAEKMLPKAPNTVLKNGARFYVDHAHPEYSAPEVSDAREAVVWDRAGELIAHEAMDLSRKAGLNIVLYKNNTDGKGAAYGTHENYLMSRTVDFDHVIRLLTPLLTTRPIICGAGRLGIGQRSEQAGFQISQRADFIEEEVGIETTFDRPIINTRDESHADEALYRRLHVINGDANQFDVSNYLKTGTLALTLDLIELSVYEPLLFAQIDKELTHALIAEPVSANHVISHDPHLSATVHMNDGTEQRALDIQYRYLHAVRQAYEELGEKNATAQKIIDTWQQVLDTLNSDMWQAAPSVEWVAKFQILESLRSRSDLDWDHDKLRAFDYQWHDLRPDHSIVSRLDRAGAVRRLVNEADVRHAVEHPPQTTRAYMRGELIRRFPQFVAAAGWEAVTFDIPDRSHLLRVAMMHPDQATNDRIGSILETAETVDDFLEQLPLKRSW